MYYVKIPLRNLCEPQELKVPEGEQDRVWQKRVDGLLDDLHSGVIPAWAVSYADLKAVKLERE
jgi:hypothetical protein